MSDDQRIDRLRPPVSSTASRSRRATRAPRRGARDRGHSGGLRRPDHPRELPRQHHPSLRRPFHRGDQIATNGCEGTVIDVNSRTVVLRSFDGERLLVPCSQVLANPIANYTALGQRRTTFAVSVSYDTNHERARSVLLDVVNGVEGVLGSPKPEVWIEEVADSDIRVAIRFRHAPDIATLRGVRKGVAVGAKRALERSGIRDSVPPASAALH